MKLMHCIFVAVFVLLPGLDLLQAQEAEVTTGGDFSGSGGKVSFSVGQVFYTTIDGGVVSVAQGVQQAYEISVISGIVETHSMNLNISVYPNPTFDYIHLKIDSLSPDNYASVRYQLIGIDGRILINEKVSGNELKIGMRTYGSGIYFLRITDKNREVQTFKIVKF